MRKVALTGQKLFRKDVYTQGVALGYFKAALQAAVNANTNRPESGFRQKRKVPVAKECGL